MYVLKKSSQTGWIILPRRLNLDRLGKIIKKQLNYYYNKEIIAWIVKHTGMEEKQNKLKIVFWYMLSQKETFRLFWDCFK